MDFLATPTRRKFLFASLYLSEGAPIGFIWLALPTRLRAGQVPIDEITWLTAVLVLPWTFKFAWAPLVDVLRSQSWTLRHWIVLAQSIMGLALLPLVWLDLKDDFQIIAGLLLTHAFAAATQDVAIDALCISITDVTERGTYNGWMQAGMLLGRALMGGGALVMAQYIGPAAIVVLLILLTTFSMLLLLSANIPAERQNEDESDGKIVRVLAAARTAVLQRNTWIGLLFAFTGGAAFKSLEVIYGPFLVDRGFSQEEIGWFSAGPMIFLMIAGSLVGGRLADRIGYQRFVAGASCFIVLVIACLAASDFIFAEQRGGHLLVFLAAAAFGIGLFTASSYALFMSITAPRIAATQFSAFMGATNGCESWSSYAIGLIIASHGYAIGILAMSAASLVVIPLVFALRISPSRSP